MHPVRFVLFTALSAAGCGSSTPTTETAHNPSPGGMGQEMAPAPVQQNASTANDGCDTAPVYFAFDSSDLDGSLDGLHVLVAEDDPEMRGVIVETLLRDGAEVSEAASGLMLFDRIRRLATTGQMPDLLISDVRMPGLSGLQVLSMMRERGWSVPIILITAFGDEDTHNEASRLGATAVFDKIEPCRPEGSWTGIAVTRKRSSPTCSTRDSVVVGGSSLHRMSMPLSRTFASAISSSARASPSRRATSEAALRSARPNAR